VLVLCLLCGACAAAKQRYLSVSMDEELLRSKQAHLDCPPWKKSGTDHDRTINYTPALESQTPSKLAAYSCSMLVLLHMLPGQAGNQSGYFILRRKRLFFLVRLYYGASMGVQLLSKKKRSSATVPWAMAMGRKDGALLHCCPKKAKTDRDAQLGCTCMHARKACEPMSTGMTMSRDCGTWGRREAECRLQTADC